MKYTIEELLQGEAALAEDCERCGEICGSGHVLIMTTKEWTLIAKALDRTPSGLALSTRAVPIPTHEATEYRMTIYPCAFLDEGHTCIIHTIRPQVCRDWPYLKAVKQTKQGKTPNLETKCPAINKWKKRMEKQR